MILSFSSGTPYVFLLKVLSRPFETGLSLWREIYNFSQPINVVKVDAGSKYVGKYFLSTLRFLMDYIL